MKPLGVAEISCDDLLKQSSLEDVTVSPDLCSPAHLLTCRGNNLQTHSDSLWTADDTWTFVFLFLLREANNCFFFLRRSEQTSPLESTTRRTVLLWLLFLCKSCIYSPGEPGIWVLISFWGARVFKNKMSFIRRVCDPACSSARCWKMWWRESFLFIVYFPKQSHKLLYLVQSVLKHLRRKRSRYNQTVQYQKYTIIISDKHKNYSTNKT